MHMVASMHALQTLVTSLMLAVALTAQTVPDRVLVGYWHNWGYPNALPLTAIPAAYDVINIAFATPSTPLGATMQFTPFAGAYPNSQDFINDVAALQAAGKKVLISIGGAADPMHVDSPAAAQAFANSMRNIITTYGFDGIDIDLEGSSFLLDAGDSNFQAPTTPRIVHFLSGMNQLLAQLPSDFMLTAAPETAMVQGGMSAYAGVWGCYLPLLHAFHARFDWIQVQHYNTGSMFGRDGNVYLPATEDFHVAMADALLGGFTAASGIALAPFAPRQVVIGLPASASAAGSGQTAAPIVHAALDRLILGRPATGYQLADANAYPNFRGVMTWSINWDVHAGLAFSQPHRDYLDRVFLDVDVANISQATGGTATFSLTAGRANAGRGHLLIVGFTGTSPGTALPGGVTLPINLDALSSLVVDPGFGSVLSGFVGTLDNQGDATAQLVLPAIYGLAGLQLSFAYTLDAPWDFASTSATVVITP